MPKITRPLFSDIARGAFARALIYQDNGTTKTVKRYRVPRNRRTTAVALRRNRFRAAVRTWHELTSTERAEWFDAAKNTNLNAWQLYVSEYLRHPPVTNDTTWDNDTTLWDYGTTRWDHT